MDNSSSNIVKFIATITVAVLLLMAASYYAQSQKAPAQPAIVEKADPVKVDTVEPDPALSIDENSSEAEDPDEEIEPINGQPSADIPVGGTPDIPSPPSEG